MERSPAGEAPLVSVVVVTWNARADLEACLASLAAQTDRDFETVVVDNGSQDGSISRVRQLYPDVRVVETGRNLGFAEGCNRGIAASRGRWIATLNNDALADPHWIEALRRAIESAAPGLGMVQCRILRLERRDVLASTGVVLRPDGCFEDRDAGRPARVEPSEAGVFCACAAAALYRREMLEAVRLSSGIFDRSYFAYFEDVDLGWRARLAGWEAVYWPEATVFHAEHASARRRAPGFVVRQCRRNRVRTLVKNASPGFLFRAMPRLLRDAAGEVGDGPRELGSWLLAAWDGLRQRGEVARHARLPRPSLERHWIDPSPPPTLG
jgi:GT2 family glycosyltransferase